MQADRSPVIHLRAVAVTADGLQGYDTETLSASDAANDGLRAHVQRVAEVKLRNEAEKAHHPVVAVTFVWEDAGDNTARIPDE